MLTTKLGINFIIPENEKYQGFSEFSGSIDDNWSLFSCAEWAWIVQTYLNIAEVREDIYHSQSPRNDMVNIIFCDDYLKLKNKWSYFCVVVLADRSVYFPGDYNIIQNVKFSLPFKCRYITHWTQRGIIPSNGLPRPKQKINIGFLGVKKNSINLNFLSHTNDDIKVINKTETQWNDFSDLDVVVSVRDYNNDYKNKPPTKLLNAWKAGVPFIGGNDSAYHHVGESGKNFISVRDEYELKDAIKNLIYDKAFRESIIKEGYKAFQNYNDDKISNEWCELFDHLKDKVYPNWYAKSFLSKRLLECAKNIYYIFLRFKRKINYLISR